MSTILMLVTLFGFVITASSFQMNIKKANEERIRREEDRAKKQTEHHTELRTRLSSIETGVKQMQFDIKVDFKSIENDISGISERITRVEESSKSAHRRLDEYEKRCK